MPPTFNNPLADASVINLVTRTSMLADLGCPKSISRLIGLGVANHPVYYTWILRQYIV